MRDLKQEADVMLKNMKKATADRDRAEQQRILENQWKREAKEQAEADRLEQSNELLNKYMPEQLSLEEVNKIIDEAFANVNPTSSKDMGLIMKEVSPKLKGKADMSKVNAIIKEKLANL